jgi:hypothetical protein
MSLDLVAILTRAAHVYDNDCPCDDCAETRAILDAHVDDAEVYDALADTLAAEHSAAARDALDADAAQSTRDDGALYHGRLPCDDTDAFNPHITWMAPARPALVPSRSTILPPPSRVATAEAELFTRSTTVQPAPLPRGDRAPFCTCGAAREPYGLGRVVTKWECRTCGRVERVRFA